MKKLLCLFFIALALGMSFSVSAVENTQLVYEYYFPHVTVTFEDTLGVSNDVRQGIADSIYSSVVESDSLGGEEAPNNLICTLFGHNFNTNTVTATYHKVRENAPRCRVEVYHVSVCSRCNHSEQELVNSFYTFCCPEE